MSEIAATGPPSRPETPNSTMTLLTASRVSTVAPVAAGETGPAARAEAVRPADAVHSAAGGLRARTARSGAVTMAAQGLRTGVRVGSMMILARLLTPADFGLQGMVLVVTGFISLFKDAGLGLATVQSKTITHEQTSTLFWINVTLGVLLAMVVIGAAPLLAVFYAEPRLKAIATVSAVAFIFNGLCVQHQAQLQRNLRFAALAVVDVTSVLASTLVGIGMALAGFGYWALVGMTLSVSAVNAVGLWIAMPWMPGKPRRGQDLRSMLHLGGTWTFVGVSSYIAYNVEKMLLGRYWGAVPLGLYGRAYQLISLPTEMMTSVGTVVTAALSRLQHDPEKLRRAFMVSYSFIVSLTIPITLVCALLADQIVAIVLGPRWVESAAILRALAPTTLAFALMYPFAWFFASTAGNRVSIGTALMVPPGVILGIVTGLPYGPVGVAIGYSAGVSLVAVPVILWCRAEARIPMRGLWDAIRRPLWAGLAAGGCTFAVKAALGDAVTPLLALAVEVGAMIAVYAWILLVIFGLKGQYVGLIQSVLGRTGSRV
jgi:O-antigen/teichoic acid export membrane protein